MKKLLGFYKNIPPEMRVFIAMAGLGTPIGVIYLLKRHLFPNASIFVIIIGVFAAVAILGGIAWLCMKLFGGSSRKRQKKMEAQLASGAESGPVSLDVRGAIKSNNEKFFGQIKEMRKLGISVYDLPWYIVIGDSGCGKTKLINESGLTFSTGKPEGYQLGTLNYNWWFTEDAIFVDMAGRLVNPQEDADRREWEAFLKTVAQGRKGYPINGAIVCISADHLLQDTPEKHEEDANTILERLRDLQNKLGVTFATYLVITKCDKILGFMQFFDRAERDLLMKNQIFGWSRPGSFAEPYDPENFDQDFNEIYGRLNELRLRRLNDDADEVELGMAYSFPEEFRALREPLHTYVRTLFPLIRSPRAVKNLMFRGAYFTSATQQGGLILRSLVDRMGEAAAQQFGSLESMYPKPRPHFVKELLFRKVFPEFGLVFRNEQEVERKRKLAKVFTYVSAGVAVVLFAALIVSWMRFDSLIASPSERAQAGPLHAYHAEYSEALDKSQALREDINTLEGNLWANLLSLYMAGDQPARDLKTIRVKIFEEAGLQQRLRDIEESLQAARIVADDVSPQPGQIPVSQFVDALGEYLRWTACADRDERPEWLDHASYETLSKVAAASGQRAQLTDNQATDYFTALDELDDPRNPARFLLAGENASGVEPGRVVAQAVSNLRDYFTPYAAFDSEHPDQTLSEWARIRTACETLMSNYRDILQIADSQVNSAEQAAAFQDDFAARYNAFTSAKEAITWNGPNRIEALADVLLRERERWLTCEAELLDMYSACREEPDPADPFVRLITSLRRDSNVKGLDRVLYESLVDAELVQGAALNSAQLDEFFAPETFRGQLTDVTTAYAYVFTKITGDNFSDDQLVITEQTRAVAAELDDIRDKLNERGSADFSEPRSLAQWNTILRGLTAAPSNEPQTADFGALELDPAWRPQRLASLRGVYLSIASRRDATATLEAFHQQVANSGDWGVASMADGWADPVGSFYRMRMPDTRPSTPRSADPATPAAPDEADAGGLFGGGQRRSEPAARPERSQLAGGSSEGIPIAATRSFLISRAAECFPVLQQLSALSRDDYLPQQGDDLHERCTQALEDAWRAYANRYMNAWRAAYDDSRLEALDSPDSQTTWNSFASQFSRRGRSSRAPMQRVEGQLRQALTDILENVTFAKFNNGEWLGEGARVHRVARFLGDAVSDAERDHWSTLTLVRDPRAMSEQSDRARDPWEVVTTRVIDEWRDWSQRVGDAAELPTDFGPSAPPRTLPTLSIGVFTDLRNELGFEDEKFTKALVDLERDASTLLSRALSGVYAQVEQRTFGEIRAYRGWPYTNPDGRGVSATDTVDFPDFEQFLDEIVSAEESLAPLEQGVPNDDRYAQRRREYAGQCKAWRDFIENPLTVTVTIGDPVALPLDPNVEVTAQNYYSKTKLTLGLERSEGGVDGLEFSARRSERGDPQRTSWKWVTPPLNNSANLQFELIEPVSPDRVAWSYPEIDPQALGRPSPLAFPAYLHRYGVQEDGLWRTVHTIDLVEALDQRYHGSEWGPEQVVGEMYVFTVTPALPEAITPLREEARPRP